MFSIRGDTLDDLNTLKEQVQQHPSLSICSSGTEEYAFHELAQQYYKQITDKGITSMHLKVKLWIQEMTAK